MGERLGVPISPAESARDAVMGADIVITITDSPTPVVFGEWLEAGMFVCAAGGAHPSVSELDEAAVRRAAAVAVDDREQAKMESGELIAAAARGALAWERTAELNRIVAGRVPGRPRADSITLFKSLGMALWDVAAAKAVYDRVRDEGIGRRL